MTSIRARLAGDPDLGAGNTLETLIRYGVRPDEPTIAFDTDVDGYPAGRLLTLGELDRAVAARAHWLHEAGVRPRDPVAVIAATAADNVLTFLALARLGAIAALVNARLTPEVAAGYIDRLGATALLGPRSLLGHTPAPRGGHGSSAPRGGGEQGVRWLGENAPAGDPDQAPSHYRHHGSDPVAITHSSGTTGVPKAVTGTHDSLFAAIRHRLTAPRAQGLDRWLSALPAAHNSTLTILNLALCNRTELLALSTQDGMAALTAIEEFRPGTVLGFAGTWSQLAGVDLATRDLDSVRVWWNTGDSAHEAHIRHLTATGRHQVPGVDGPTWRSGSVFVDNLGSSELGHSVFSITHRPDTSRYGRCVGRPDPYAEAAVLDPTGTPVPDGEPGMLAVRTPSMSPGYWNDSAATYRSRVGGWLLTGDVVYRDPDGWYYHLDRVPDAITLADGTRVYTVLTEERILAGCPEVTDCTVAPTPDAGIQILVHLTANPGRAGTPGQTLPVEAGSDLLEVVRAVLDPVVAAAVRRVVVAAAGQIPLGATGKVRKIALRTGDAPDAAARVVLTSPGELS
ncbi:acyl-CoA synthetase [Longispora fulva]|uniref:Acyl-coenzyme A synthetase/AMP-(Fatty) acid ligase n=1 Tax=Longispora fulva TaxID=619741 RepID=A0A8J7KKQ5_9ACTN|nr:class I adenylate-forming enzyme family protein [Longispora fulva]MBG6141525.1 acyl-coenzyme A synthetase/AMP-(fatty) acid ligase [Longispora fulva]GIG59324.1 acyl-CoA synthetase [Longispora fulva]